MRATFRTASLAIVIALITVSCSSGPTAPQEPPLPTWMFGRWAGSTDTFELELRLNAPTDLFCLCYASGPAYVTRTDTRALITLEGAHSLVTVVGQPSIQILLWYPGGNGTYLGTFHGDRTNDNTMTGYLRVIKENALAMEVFGGDSVAFVLRRQ